MVRRCKWFVILIGFCFYMYYLISSKKLSLFIHPKMIKYVVFAALVLGILAVLELIKIIFDKSKKYNSRVSSVFLIPLILAYIVNPQGLDSGIASKKGVVTNKYSFSSSSAITHGDDGVIKFTDANFSDMTNDISYNINKYKGKKVNISGFIYRDKSFPKDHFVVARMLIICCAADAEVTGLVCSLNNSSNLKDNAWVSITGTIDSMNNFDRDYSDEKIIPVIKIDSVKTIAKPSNPYIYLKRT